MYQEFMDLKQGSLSFEEYLNKFNELSRFGPELVNIPLKKNERFIRGMNKKFHERMTGHIKESFSDLVDMGYRYATLDMQEPRQRKEIRAIKIERSGNMEARNHGTVKRKRRPIREAQQRMSLAIIAWRRATILTAARSQREINPLKQSPGNAIIVRKWDMKLKTAQL